ncbi:MAG: DUF559 domain-containing protein [Verrucomicrobia bacterium]|nr:DUF559 domain-containing protein [Verrucomicrobiota bacterium]
MHQQNPKLTVLARNLRKDDSWGEPLLWSWLRDRRFSAYKFRRQLPLDPYILDFYCAAARLDIEVDGFQHGRSEHQAADLERDAWLAARGIKVLRFWSSRLRRDKEAIRDTIWRTLQERVPQPVPEYCKLTRVPASKTKAGDSA